MRFSDDVSFGLCCSGSSLLRAFASSLLGLWLLFFLLRECLLPLLLLLLSLLWKMLQSTVTHSRDACHDVYVVSLNTTAGKMGMGSAVDAVPLSGEEWLWRMLLVPTHHEDRTHTLAIFCDIVCVFVLSRAGG